ncbi:3-hydroxyisobutyrate dehydrogenase [Trinickia symbiotica]|uniref:NAD(P)-dependent oxidoreductase n=1 Tax=Trinickia symbiotica TaxID=863227 RepID=A0A2N7WL96_9BURK|nr:NAD(P)-dependent oxidoreductase [Trinickia symbiotica]PMS30144.1 NAD(P)-dependent oxidoreductase [Trinickia symbiotica]PPK41170.1 3-hydroxyisobutyrate dehydrogenase [Trinickia symbiotica]
MTNQSTRIGYVGLGNMGGALARRLQLTHPLRVYDMNADAVAGLVEAGAEACGALPELAAACNVILLCLPTSAHVRTVIFGRGGLAEGVRPGTLIIDQTSGDPTETRAMASELASRQIALIDAPVSGGAPGATAGTIAIMVGAGPQEWERVKPVLTAISPNVFHAGDVGTGHVIKLVTNVISGAQRLLTLEAVALAAKNGIDPKVSSDILRRGGARNAYIETVLGDRIAKGKLDVPFSLALMHKDVKLACKLASDSGVPMLFGSLTQELYQLCINEMGGGAGVDTAALVIDRISGTHIVPNGQA